MSKQQKSWKDKFSIRTEAEVEVLNKKFSDMQEGDRMLISTPAEIESYIFEIPKGKIINVKTIRKDLALLHHCDNTCPLTTGIFLRIVAEKNYEEYLQGKPLTKIAPFWRAIPPKSTIIKKLSFGSDFVLTQQEKESGTIDC